MTQRNEWLECAEHCMISKYSHRGCKRMKMLFLDRTYMKHFYLALSDRCQNFTSSCRWIEVWYYFLKPEYNKNSLTSL